MFVLSCLRKTVGVPIHNFAVSSDCLRMALGMLPRIGSMSTVANLSVGDLLRVSHPHVFIIIPNENAYIYIYIYVHGDDLLLWVIARS